MAKLSDIEGIGATYMRRLRKAGIRSVKTLLQKGATPKGRKELAANTSISEQVILEWVNRADLLRVPGIGSQYSVLLEAAGVDTVRELAQRKASPLFEVLQRLNEEKNMVTRLPAQQVVEIWVGHAKSLPRLLEIPKLSQASEPSGSGGGRPYELTTGGEPSGPGPGRPGGRKEKPAAGKIKRK
jgi:predicted flap endonuclease-1-like 5' DNA nuclease